MPTPFTDPCSYSHWGFWAPAQSAPAERPVSDEPVADRVFRAALAFFGTFVFALGGASSEELTWLHESAVSSHDSRLPC